MADPFDRAVANFHLCQLVDGDVEMTVTCSVACARLILAGALHHMAPGPNTARDCVEAFLVSLPADTKFN